MKRLILFSLVLACGEPTGTSGRKWVVQASGTTRDLWAVWGMSPNDVFAVGDSGTIVHFDGTGWSLQASGTQGPLWDVWGSSPSDAFAVGRYGPLLHFDGTTWSVRSGLPSLINMGLWGRAANDVWLFGHTFDASAFAVILHYDAVSWTGDTLRNASVLGDLWGLSASNVVAVGGNGVVVRYNGSGWTPEHWGDLTWSLSGAWGSGASDLFAVGGLQDGFGSATSLVLHFDGARWARMRGVAVADLFLSSVWGTSSRDVFAVGHTPIAQGGRRYGAILHYDGRRWRYEEAGVLDPLADVWMTEGDVFAVGSGGLIVRGSR